MYRIVLRIMVSLDEFSIQDILFDRPVVFCHEEYDDVDIEGLYSSNAFTMNTENKIQYNPIT